jgi:hypothetical protein
MLRTWWAALALLAIFAMHGLASHASAAEPIPVPIPVATPSVAAVADAPHAAHHAHADAAPEAAPAAPVAALDGGGHDGGHHAMQVLGLCVAVLATAAIALLRLTRPTRGVLAVRPRALRSATVPVPATYAHAPPDLHALSVLRC